jgi:hypothetical protein
MVDDDISRLTRCLKRTALDTSARRVATTMTTRARVANRAARCATTRDGVERASDRAFAAYPNRRMSDRPHLVTDAMDVTSVRWMDGCERGGERRGVGRIARNATVSVGLGALILFLHG